MCLCDVCAGCVPEYTSLWSWSSPTFTGVLGTELRLSGLHEKCFTPLAHSAFHLLFVVGLSVIQVRQADLGTSRDLLVPISHHAIAGLVRRVTNQPIYAAL